MSRKLRLELIISTSGGFIIFYISFWLFTLFIYVISSGLIGIERIPMAIIVYALEAIEQLPPSFLFGFPVFLAALLLSNRLSSGPYVNVGCHALLAVPLSGLVLASNAWPGPSYLEDWHEIVRLAMKWPEASLPSGAIAGYASWKLRPPRARDGL